MTKVLKAENLIKKYGDFYAVNDIDLNLKKGEVVGLLLSLIHISEPTRP